MNSSWNNTSTDKRDGTKNSRLKKKVIVKRNLTSDSKPVKIEEAVKKGYVSNYENNGYDRREENRQTGQPRGNKGGQIERRNNEEDD